MVTYNPSSVPQVFLHYGTQSGIVEDRMLLFVLFPDLRRDWSMEDGLTGVMKGCVIP